MKPKNFPARKAARQMSAIARLSAQVDMLGRPNSKSEGQRRLKLIAEAKRRLSLTVENPRDIRTKKDRTSRAKLGRNA